MDNKNTSIHPAIHQHLSCTPSCLRVKVDFTLGKSPVCYQHSETNNRACTHTTHTQSYGQLPVSLRCMSLDCGRKSKYSGRKQQYAVNKMHFQIRAFSSKRTCAAAGAMPAVWAERRKEKKKKKKKKLLRFPATLGRLASNKTSH